MRFPVTDRRSLLCPVIVLSLVSLVVAAGIARAATINIGIGLDTDSNAATGCVVSTSDGSITGIDQVATTVVSTTTAGATVARLERQLCVSGTLGAPVTYDAGGWNVGLGVGTNGSALVETRIPLLSLPQVPIARAFVMASASGGGRDATAPFTLAVAPLVFAPPLPVPLPPLLAPALALLIALVAALHARRLQRHAGVMLVVVTVLTASTLAWAATVLLDGNAGDWNGVTPVVVDSKGDAPADADLIAVFVQRDDVNIYFRIDADIRKESPVNVAPTVNAGADQAVTLPGSASLVGTASDDGLPAPPGMLTYAWTKVSGPGSVSFSNASLPVTSATFGPAGTYVLRLSASDGALSAADDVTVAVVASAQANQPPRVIAGVDQVITLPARASLVGTVLEDGRSVAAGRVSLAWSTVSGPGTVTFADSTAARTEASFSAPGTYVLRLTASDGAMSADSSLTIVARLAVPVNAPPSVSAGDDHSIRLPDSAALSGNVSDDGLPNPATLSLAWTKQSGPGSVTFGNSSSLSTTATFSVAGAYVLRLTASDGALTSNSDVSVRVGAALPPPPAPIAADDSYRVRVGETLMVPAPGVLSNDEPASGLTAIKLSDPAKGTLSALAADGGFTYQAPAAFTRPGVEPTVLWRQPHSIEGHASVIDFNRDGAPDIVSKDYGSLQAHDGRTGALLWRLDLGDKTDVDVAGCSINTYGSTVATGDVTGNGEAWIFLPINCDYPQDAIITDRYVGINGTKITNGKVRPRWVSPRFSKPHPDAHAQFYDTAPPATPIHPSMGTNFRTDPTLARLAVDGGVKLLSRRLVHPTDGYYFAGNGRNAAAGCRAVTGIVADEGRACRATHIVDATTGVIDELLVAPNPTNEVHIVLDFPSRQNAPIVADLDGDGQVEIISGSDVFKRVGGAWTLHWQSRWEPNSVAVADLDGDGKAEVIHYQTPYNGNRPEIETGIMIYRHDGALIRRIPAPATDLPQGWISVGDIDGDGVPEILSPNGGFLYAYRGDGVLAWMYSVPDIPTPVPNGSAPAPVFPLNRTGLSAAQVYDLDLDGKPEVLLNGSARIIILDGATGIEKWSMDHEGYAVGQRTLSLVDFDGDGHVDIGVFGSTRWNCATLTGGPALCLGNALVLKGGQHWAPGPNSFNQMNYRPGAIDSAGKIVYDPSIRRDWKMAAQQGTVVDTRQRDGATLTYAARNASGTSTPATVAIAIEPPNRPPVITSIPPTALLSASPFTRPIYQITAVDSDPGDTLRYELVETTHPFGAGTGVSVDATTGATQIYAGPCGSGAGPCEFGHVMIVVAAIDALGASARQGFIVYIGRDGATVPDVVGKTRSAAIDAVFAAGLAPRVLQSIHSQQPAGTVLAQFPLPGAAGVARGASVDLTLSKGPQPAVMPYVVGMTLDAANAKLASVGLAASVTSTFSATVPAGEVMTQSPAFGTQISAADASSVALGVSAGPPLAAPIAQIVIEPGPGAGARLSGDTIAYRAFAIFGDKTSADITLAALWSSSTPMVAKVDSTGGAKTLTAGTATIAAKLDGHVGQVQLVVTGGVIGDTTPPTAAITAPVDGSLVTGPITVTGTAADVNFHRYELSLADGGDDTWTVIASGTTPVTAGTLGQFDPTLLVNGVYVLRLSVFDRGGNVTSATSSVIVEGNRKIGNFTLAYTDLVVPLAGIPIQVIRSYDTRVTTTGEFGVGWTLGLKSLKVSASGPQGSGWQVIKQGQEYSLVAVNDHVVSVTLPDGRVEKFDVRITPTRSPLVPFSTVKASFVPRAGTLGTLVALDNTDLLIVEPQPGPVTLVDDGTLNTFHPDRFLYAQRDGTQFVVSRTKGVESAQDNNGNRIVVTSGGITHSSGAAITFARDSKQRITAITDPAGKTRTYAYSADGDLASATDRTGNTTRYFYDRGHRLLRIEDPLGNRPLRNDYDDDGRLVSTTDANGHTTKYTHDVPGRQERVEDALGRVTVMTYDDRGNVTAVTDPLGNTSRFTYDARDRRLTQTDPLGATRSFTWDAQDKVSDIVDPLGRKTSFTWDASGRRLTTRDPRGSVTSHAYDPAGNVTAITDPLGNSTRYASDTAGNPTAITTAGGAVTRIGYDAVGRRTQSIDAGGVALGFQYDANGNTLGQQGNGPTHALGWDSEGRVTQMTTGPTARAYGYDAAGRLKTATTGRNRTVTVDTDPAGQLTGVVDAGARPLISYRYDAVGNVIGASHANGGETVQTFDAGNRVVRVEAPGGGVESYAYDAAGRRTSRTDARGNTTRYAYDAAGQLTSVTDALGGVTRFEYDASGNRTAVIDAAGHTTRYAYDAANRLTSTTHPDGAIEALEYDADNRVARQTDALGRSTAFTRDAEGRVLAITDALGGVTRHAYEDHGVPTSTTNAVGNVTQRAFDASGRHVRTTFPSGAFETIDYDASGNVTGKTNGQGESIRYQYDSRGRLDSVALPGGQSETFTYDADGLLLSAVDARGTTTYAYDPTSRRVTRVTEPDGRYVRYAYDVGGLRTEVAHGTAGSELVTRYAYDSLGRIESITDPAGGVTKQTRDAVGNVVAVVRPDGTQTLTTHDSRNRPLSITHRNAANAMLRQEIHTYDAVGNRTLSARNDGLRVEYEYDALSRLTRERHLDTAGIVLFDSSYGYDAAGNVMLAGTPSSPVFYEYNADGQVVSGGGISFTYDAAGRRIRETFIAGGVAKSIEYGWDAKGRLSSYRDASAAATSYTYDTGMVRQGKSSAAGATRYLVDRSHPSGFSQLLGRTTPFGADSFVWGEKLLQATESGTARHPLQDALGSTRLLVTGGSVTDAFDYKAYGEPLVSAGTSRLPHRFAGEETDDESGLVYLRSRYYDPRTRSFLTRDTYPGRVDEPLSQLPYAYTAGNPVNHTDPSGMDVSIASTLYASTERLYLQGKNALNARKAIISAKHVGFNSARLVGGVMGFEAVLEEVGGSRSRVDKWFGGGVITRTLLNKLDENVSEFVDTATRIAAGINMIRAAYKMLGGDTVFFGLEGVGIIASESGTEAVDKYVHLLPDAEKCRDPVNLALAHRDVTPSITFCLRYLAQPYLPTKKTLTQRGHASHVGIMLHEFTHIAFNARDDAYECLPGSVLPSSGAFKFPGASIMNADSYRCWAEDNALAWSQSSVPKPQ